MYVSESIGISSQRTALQNQSVWSMDHERAMDSCIRGLSEVLAENIGRTIRDLNKIHQSLDPDYPEMGVPLEFHQAGSGGVILADPAATHLVTTPRLLGSSRRVTTPRSASAIGIAPVTPKTEAYFSSHSAPPQEAVAVISA